MGFRDMDLDDQVKAALRKDAQLSAFRIDVNVRNGIVHLRGQISEGARDQVVRLARSVESVAAVVDEMSVT